MGNKRLLPFRIAVAILAIVLIGALLGSERGMALVNRPVVAHLATIKQPPDLDLREVLDGYGLHVVRPGITALRMMGLTKPMPNFIRPSADDPMSEPAVGHSIREIGFFGMPFGWTADLGDVVYMQNSREYVYAPLNPEGVARVNAANGRNVFEGNIFPFWAHSWGWLWIAGLGLAFWLWHRAQVQRREELGLID